MEEIGGMKMDKKHLLYIGGAIASIGALYLFMRNRSQNVNYGAAGGAPSGGGGSASGASDAALQAAQMQSATALAIEQGRENVALQQITSAEKIALGAQMTAENVARINQQGAIATAALKTGSPIAAAAGKGLQSLFGGGSGGGSGAPGSPNTGANWFEKLSPSEQGQLLSGLPPNFYDPTFSDVGADYTIGPQLPAGYQPDYAATGSGNDTFNWPVSFTDTGYSTSTGGGSSDYFGTGPTTNFEGGL